MVFGNKYFSTRNIAVAFAFFVSVIYSPRDTVHFKQLEDLPHANHYVVTDEMFDYLQAELDVHSLEDVTRQLFDESRDVDSEVNAQAFGEDYFEAFDKVTPYVAAELGKDVVRIPHMLLPEGLEQARPESYVVPTPFPTERFELPELTEEVAERTTYVAGYFARGFFVFPNTTTLSSLLSTMTHENGHNMGLRDETETELVTYDVLANMALGGDENARYALFRELYMGSQRISNVEKGDDFTIIAYGPRVTFLIREAIENESTQVLGQSIDATLYLLYDGLTKNK